MTSVLKVRQRREARRRVAQGLLALCVAGGTGALASPDPAFAAPTGRVIADPYVILRSDVSTSSARLGTIPRNTVVNINCTRYGGAVSGPYGTTTLWNQVSYGGQTGFVTDAWLLTGSNGPVAPACGSTPPPAPAPVASRETRALAWARGQLGATGWNGWCDRFVANAYGRTNSGYSTAYVHYQSLQRRGLIRTTGTPPAGALAFYGPASVNGGAGHVQISEGNGWYITTASTVRRVQQSYPGAPYLGWAYADPEWPGR